MSTKATIAYGLTFHFVPRGARRGNFVYLEIEGAQFEASYNGVMVPIPVHIWKVIRRYPGIDLSYANKTDDEIQDYVEHEVDERIGEDEKASERAKGIASLSGSLVFGPADQTRDRQIAAGTEYFIKVREHQRQVKEAIAKLEQANRKS